MRCGRISARVKSMILLTEALLGIIGVLIGAGIGYFSPDEPPVWSTIAGVVLTTLVWNLTFHPGLFAVGGMFAGLTVVIVLTGNGS